jgi:hypothetical protein
MRSHVRISLLALLLGVVFAGSAPAAQAAFGVASWEASTCTTNTPECTYATPSAFYTQASGHPQFGITEFVFNSKTNVIGKQEPEGAVKNLRIDLPPGLIVNPEVTETLCNKATLAENKCPTSSEVGEDQLTVFVPSAVEFPPKSGEKVGIDLPLVGKAYNLEPANGVPLEIGVEIEEKALGINQQVYLVGGVSWNTDYHDYFTISNLPNAQPLLKSRLIFKGRLGGGFLTMPSTCGSVTTSLRAESYGGEVSSKSTTPPAEVSGCNLVSFAPSLLVTPETTQSDLPDGATTELKVPQDLNPEDLEPSTLKDATVILPEGMTLNPSGATGLTGCTPEQIGIGTTNAVSCPESSMLGKVAIEVPTLPPGSLTGNIYLGKPASEAITKPPYTMYLDAESSRYGISVRQQGSVAPDPSTGRLTATFLENPRPPFSNLKLTFKGGATAPLANPLACGPAKTETSLTPYSGNAPATPFYAFTVDANGKGGACVSPLPFQLTQSTPPQTPATAGAYSPFTLNLGRADGQQYLSKVKTTLPAGLVGTIPSVPLCQEPQAAAGTCSTNSKIGEATVTAGAGLSPFTFTGPVYLTGPFEGAPYGMTIAIPAVAGPFNLGPVITRAKIQVEQNTGRVIVSSNLPTIVGGIPLRLKSLSVAVNRSNFLLNPTNCSALLTETTLTSTLGATQNLSSPFQVGGCGSLAFSPKLTAATSARTSRANGASLQVKITQTAHQASIHSVLVTLPKQLPSRLTTLQKACPEAMFNANPFGCPTSSRVGGASVTTPVLPEKLTGPAYLVSHGGAAFPDLEVILQGDNGVEVILDSKTTIKNGVTTSTFPAIPDVPMSSFSLNLPIGGHSVFTANGNLCAKPLAMPTTIMGQNGGLLKKSTKISVSNCPVRILGQRVAGHTAILTVQTPAAGRVSGSGSGLRTSKRTLSKAAGKATVKVTLSNQGLRTLARRGSLKVRLRVGFIPKTKHPTSKAFVTVTFR